MTIIRIGVDTSNHVFQVHGVSENEQAVLRRQVRRGEVEKFFTQLAPTRTGTEACGASHHWARHPRGLGHEVMLIAPVHQALRQARQERGDRRRGGLRSDELADHAVCAGRNRRAHQYLGHLALAR